MEAAKDTPAADDPERKLSLHAVEMLVAFLEFCRRHPADAQTQTERKKAEELTELLDVDDSTLFEMIIARTTSTAPHRSSSRSRSRSFSI